MWADGIAGISLPAISMRQSSRKQVCYSCYHGSLAFSGYLVRLVIHLHILLAFCGIIVFLVVSGVKFLASWIPNLASIWVSLRSTLLIWGPQEFEIKDCMRNDDYKIMQGLIMLQDFATVEGISMIGGQAVLVDKWSIVFVLVLILNKFGLYTIWEPSYFHSLFYFIIFNVFYYQ